MNHNLQHTLIKLLLLTRYMISIISGNIIVLPWQSCKTIGGKLFQLEFPFHTCAVFKIHCHNCDSCFLPLSLKVERSNICQLISLQHLYDTQYCRLCWHSGRFALTGSHSSWIVLFSSRTAWNVVLHSGMGGQQAWDLNTSVQNQA